MCAGSPVNDRKKTRPIQFLGCPVALLFALGIALDRRMLHSRSVYCDD